MSNIDHESSSSSGSDIHRNEPIGSNEPRSNLLFHGEHSNSNGDVAQSAVSSTNDEVAIYSNFNCSTDQRPQNSYRVSPYDTVVSENLLGDDRTIDAAVVEAIIEDNNNLVVASHEHNSPASSSHHIIDINDGGINAAANVSAEAQLIPVAVSNQNQIPEVEPEVDIEEVHVEHDRNNMSTISALTTNTTSIDHQDTKHTPSSSTPRVTTAVVEDGVMHRQPSLTYPPIHPNFLAPAAAAFAALPPPMPQRRALVPEYRGYSAGTTLTSPPSVPMFKSTMMNIPRHSSSDHTRNSGSNESRQQLQVELPDYKDQARPVMPNRAVMSSRNASNNSGGSDNLTPNSNTPYDSGGSNRYSSGQNSQRLHNDDENIPVVAAILVPAERLAAEERLEEQWLHQQQEHRYNYENGADEPRRNMNQQSNSSHSTLTTSHTSSNNNNDNNHPTTQSDDSRREGNTQRTKSSEHLNNVPSTMSERRFWMTIILTALLLNSLLVAGAVVGGFCAAGKCTSGSSNENVNNLPPPLTNVTDSSIPSSNAPSPSPSGVRMLSQIPTLDTGTTGATIDTIPMPSSGEALVNPTFESIGGSTLSPTMLSSNKPFGIGAVTASPTIYNSSFFDNAPESSNATNDNDDLMFDGTEAPTLEVVSKTNGTNGKTDIVISFPTPSPTTINFTSGYPGPAVSTLDDPTKNSDTEIRLAVLLPIIGIIELIIVFGLYWYYRQWRTQRQKQLSYFNCDDTVPSSPVTSNAASVTDQQQEQESPSVGNASSNSTGSYADSRECGSSSNQLPTIAESSIFEV